MISVEQMPDLRDTLCPPVPTSKRTSSLRCGGPIRWQHAAVEWLRQSSLHPEEEATRERKRRRLEGPSNGGKGEGAADDGVANGTKQEDAEPAGNAKAGMENGGGRKKRKAQLQSIEEAATGKRVRVRKEREAKAGKGEEKRGRGLRGLKEEDEKEEEEEEEEGEEGELANDLEGAGQQTPPKEEKPTRRRRPGASQDIAKKEAPKRKTAEHAALRESKRRKVEVYSAPRFIPPAAGLAERNVLVIALTPQEIEEDFLAITGRKVPRRSATGLRTYEKYPQGEWQTKMTK